jgi:hypothetical protein
MKARFVTVRESVTFATKSARSGGFEQRSNSAAIGAKRTCRVKGCQPEAPPLTHSGSRAPELAVMHNSTA